MDGMQLDMDLVVDFPDLIFCDDCMAGIRRMARELVVDENSIGLSAMKEVGPGGTFLSHNHTFENFRRELWIPKLLERRNWELWEKDGSQDIRAVSLKKVMELLETKSENLLPADVAAKIDNIVDEAQHNDKSNG